MTPAYEEAYLNDAMCALGDMLDYAVHDCGCDADLFFTQFLSSGIAEQFERGNPKFVGGMSGVELALTVFQCTTGRTPAVEASTPMDKSPEYWAGWSLAYYQWKSGLRFHEMVSCGLTVSRVCSMYLLHEADISKFVEAANHVIREHLQQRDTNLKHIRKARGFSQKQLAESSGVALRMIQLYEQRQNDINRAQASTLMELAQALSCRAEDLMEPVLYDDAVSEEEQLHAELEKGYADIAAGHIKDAGEVFHGIRRDHGL